MSSLLSPTHQFLIFSLVHRSCQIPNRLRKLNIWLQWNATTHRAGKFLSCSTQVLEEIKISGKDNQTHIVLTKFLSLCKVSQENFLVPSLNEQIFTSKLVKMISWDKSVSVRSSDQQPALPFCLSGYHNTLNAKAEHLSISEHMKAQIIAISCNAWAAPNSSPGYINYFANDANQVKIQTQLADQKPALVGHSQPSVAKWAFIL